MIALVMFGVAVAAPIGEEIAFRGYLSAALTTWRGPWPAALVTGLLFGAAHVAVYPPELLPALAFFGVAAFWFTGSLLRCIAVHAFNNAIAMGTLAGWDWQIPLVVICAVTLSVVLMLPFAREHCGRRPAHRPGRRRPGAHRRGAGRCRDRPVDRLPDRLRLPALASPPCGAST